MLRRLIETTRLSGTSVVVSEKPPPGWSPDGKYLVAIAQKPSRRVLYSTGTKTWKDLKPFDAEWG